jgi:hypothetical protein
VPARSDRRRQRVSRFRTTGALARTCSRLRRKRWIDDRTRSRLRSRGAGTTTEPALATVAGTAREPSARSHGDHTTRGSERQTLRDRASPGPGPAPAHDSHEGSG